MWSQMYNFTQMFFQEKKEKNQREEVRTTLYSSISNTLYVCVCA